MKPEQLPQLKIIRENKLRSKNYKSIGYAENLDEDYIFVFEGTWELSIEAKSGVIGVGDKLFIPGENIIEVGTIKEIIRGIEVTELSSTDSEGITLKDIKIDHIYHDEVGPSEERGKLKIELDVDVSVLEEIEINMICCRRV